jgi:uncharacterized membrane protein YedE/YeeE
MKNNIVALIAGIIFGLGLAISEMVNPARVIGFLDVTGNWDPTLALVMGGALFVTVIIFPLILKRPKPVFSNIFSLPVKRDIDKQLIIGACLFGIGWGLVGFCPGPAITALVTLSPDVIIFVIAMIVGQGLAFYLEEKIIKK